MDPILENIYNCVFLSTYEIELLSDSFNKNDKKTKDVLNNYYKGKSHDNESLLIKRVEEIKFEQSRIKKLNEDTSLKNISCGYSSDKSHSPETNINLMNLNLIKAPMKPKNSNRSHRATKDKEKTKVNQRNNAIKKSKSKTKRCQSQKKYNANEKLKGTKNRKNTTTKSPKIVSTPIKKTKKNLKTARSKKTANNILTSSPLLVVENVNTY